MDKNRKYLRSVVVGLLLIGAIACFVGLFLGKSTQLETALLGAVLSSLSMAASWFASKYYAEESFNENLRTFAGKASEKVTNLSTQLNKLSVFLQQALSGEENEASLEALVSKNGRIEAAILMLDTLKSVNEGSLSDWQAVIGEEITERKQDQAEKEEITREIVEKLQFLTTVLNQATTRGGQQLEGELDSLRTEIRSLATQVSGVPINSSIPARGRKVRIERDCPSCGDKLTYRQKAKPYSIVQVNCMRCGARLYSAYTDNDFVLRPRVAVRETSPCPICIRELQFDLDPVPGSAIQIRCNSCGGMIRANRGATVIRVRPVGSGESDSRQRPAEPSEDLLRKVEVEMGAQPWPKGRSIVAAQNLGLARSAVDGAIQELVKQGRFKVQINGKLYTVDSTEVAERS